MLTPEGLAYWMMDDGSRTPSGFYLHTKSFTLNETYKLVAILHYKFDLNCSVQIHDKKSPVIYIKKDSMEKLKKLVTPFFHDELKYKIF